jgi:hypothetical protein
MDCRVKPGNDEWKCSRAKSARAVKVTPRCHGTKDQKPQRTRRGQSADRRVFLPAASSGCRSASSGTRSPLGAPPRLSFRRPNATTQLRAALPCRRIGRNTLAGFRSSPPAKSARSCCRQVGASCWRAKSFLATTLRGALGKFAKCHLVRWTTSSLAAARTKGERTSRKQSPATNRGLIGLASSRHGLRSSTISSRSSESLHFQATLKRST